MYVCVCPHDKTKTAESKIAKLVTGIVHQDTSPTNEYWVKGERSRLWLRLGLDDRVAGVSYAPLSSARLVITRRLCLYNLTQCLKCKIIYAITLQ